MADDVAGRGTQLGEVFSVRLESHDNIDGKDCGNLYGTIEISNGGSCTSMIYDRKRKDYQSIKPGEMFTLTGPSECFVAYDSMVFYFDLWNYDNDDESIREVFEFNTISRGIINDALLTEKVVGNQGSLIVNYAVFINAVQANVEVRLIHHGDDKNPNSAHVYGLVAAQDNVFRQEIQLFQISEESKQYIKVSPGERIPLFRSAVVASLDSNLTVRADLYLEYEGHEIANGSCHEIANGSVNFAPRLSGTSTQNITGAYGEIEVKITWIDVGPQGGFLI